MNIYRIECRRANTFIMAANSALQGSVPKDVFEAMAETTDKAEADFAAYQSRMAAEASNGNSGYGKG